MNLSLFNINNFDEAGENDLLEMEINESTALQRHSKAAQDDEFTIPCPSSNPTVHVDEDNSGENGIDIPGGLKEKPDAKAGVVMNSDTYNKALEDLQKSFKEGTELLSMLVQANVIQETTEQQAVREAENAMSMAWLESMENGILFEKVDRGDKKDVKAIVKDLRPKAEDYIEEEKKHTKYAYKFYKPHLLARMLTSFGTDVKGWQQIWQTRLWQVLGCITCEAGNIDDLCKRMTEKFKSELGNYKIIPYEAKQSIIDTFRLHFNYKNQLLVYFLLVDKKLPDEIKNCEE